MIRHCIILMVFALSGCTKFSLEYVGPERAEALKAFLMTCDTHGGVKYFKENHYASSGERVPRIECHDGFEIEFHYTKKAS